MYCGAALLQDIVGYELEVVGKYYSWILLPDNDNPIVLPNQSEIITVLYVIKDSLIDFFIKKILINQQHVKKEVSVQKNWLDQSNSLCNEGMSYWTLQRYKVYFNRLGTLCQTF